jgi:hypothetical protein
MSNSSGVIVAAKKIERRDKAQELFDMINSFTIAIKDIRWRAQIL